MSEPNALRSLADNLWTYFRARLRDDQRDLVRYYRAQVVSPASGGKIQIQRPLDPSVIALPYVSSAAGLAAGDQCTVLVLGSSSNAIILGDGTLSNL